MPIADKAVQCLYVCVILCNDCRDAEENRNSSIAMWAMQKEVMLKFVQVCHLRLSVNALLNLCLSASVCMYVFCASRLLC